MTTATITDSQICDLIHAACNQASADGDNWCDYVDRDLRAAGVALSDDQPDGSDVWEIVRLADGRMVRLSDESAKGGARYSIR